MVLVCMSVCLCVCLSVTTLSATSVISMLKMRYVDVYLKAGVHKVTQALPLCCVAAYNVN